MRRQTKEIQVGNLRIGGNNPIRIQTMANTDTNDIEASVAQAKRCHKILYVKIRQDVCFLFDEETLNVLKSNKTKKHPISENLSNAF